MQRGRRRRSRKSHGQVSTVRRVVANPCYECCEQLLRRLIAAEIGVPLLDGKGYCPQIAKTFTIG